MYQYARLVQTRMWREIFPVALAKPPKHETIKRRPRIMTGPCPGEHKVTHRENVKQGEDVTAVTTETELHQDYALCQCRSTGEVDVLRSTEYRVASVWRWTVETCVYLPGFAVEKLNPVIDSPRTESKDQSQLERVPFGDGYVVPPAPTLTEQADEMLMRALSELGEHGWELVTHEASNALGVGRDGYDDITEWTRRTFFLKRQA